MNGRFNIDTEQMVIDLEKQGREDKAFLTGFQEIKGNRNFVKFIPPIQKENLPKRIKNFTASHRLDLDELNDILSSLAFFGAAESIRWVFEELCSEKCIAEIIEMCAAKELDDPEFF